MTQKQSIFTSLSEFLTKQQNNPNQLKKGEYRLFFGNIRSSFEWVKRRELNEEELTITQQIHQLLTNWQENYDKKLTAIGKFPKAYLDWVMNYQLGTPKG